MQLLNDLSAKLKRYDDEISTAINRVIQSGWLVMGPEVDKFEKSFASYHARQHCISVANGTDALELALRALNVKHGSRVATVANAGAYTATALNCIGASAFFLEVAQDTQCATLESVKAALDSGVDAVVITHLFGRVVPEVAEISELCRHKGVPLLEDCAQAHGASIGTHLTGTFGDIACFSFYPTKNLGALGDGGAIITDNQSYADALTELRQYGWKSKYQIGAHGGRNSRLDEIQAALLSEFLPLLDGWNDQRLKVALRYNNEITNPLVTKPVVEQNREDKPYVAHLYVVQTALRDDLRAHLKQHDILTDVHYPIPDHQQDLALAVDNDISLSVTELLASTVLTLPCYPEMSDGQVSHVIETVNSWAA